MLCCSIRFKQRFQGIASLSRHLKSLADVNKNALLEGWDPSMRVLFGQANLPLDYGKGGADHLAAPRSATLKSIRSWRV